MEQFVGNSFFFLAGPNDAMIDVQDPHVCIDTRFAFCFSFCARCAVLPGRRDTCTSMYVD